MGYETIGMTLLVVFGILALTLTTIIIGLMILVFKLRNKINLLKLNNSHLTEEFSKISKGIRNKNIEHKRYREDNKPHYG